MLDDRNAASHVYREEIAAEIYRRVSAHADALRRALIVLEDGQR